MKQYDTWIKIAKATGRGLAQTINETSHREYLLWREHFRDEWNQPSRTDWYLMQIAREVACVLLSKEDKPKVTVSSFQLPFVEPKPKEPPKKVDRATYTEQIKSLWMGMVGYGRKRDRS